MKFLKVLLYCLGGFLFACLFTLLGVILVYIGENETTNQNYITPTITLNVGTGDRSINQLPTLETIALSFPIGFHEAFDCSNTSNLTIKVTAVKPNDPDGMISKLKFYYYNIDDPDRILEYKETWSLSPYEYFVLPKISGEYRFGVILYDNNGGIVNSEDIIGKGPVLYIPTSCGYMDVPVVTPGVDSTDVEIEGYLLELNGEQLEIYNDISTLINSIEDICIKNVELKQSLDKLRKNLNNRTEITTLLITINEQLDEGGIKIDIKQKELLDSILLRLTNVV